MQSEFLRRSILLVLSGIVSVALLVVLWQVRPPAPFTLNVGDPNADVSQFYGPELSGSTPYRWSKDLSAVSVPALATAQQISVMAGPGRPADTPTATLKLLSGNKVLGEFVLQPGWQTSTVSVSSGLGPDIRLMLESDTWYPDPVTDRRRLGVAVAMVQSTVSTGKLGIVLPPWLWLAIGALCWLPLLPLLTSPVRKVLQYVSLGVAALVPAILATILPETGALPVVAWAWGLASGAALFILAWRWRGLSPDSPFVKRVAHFFRYPWRELLAVGVGSALLAVLMTWPLAAHIGDSLPGFPGDNFAFLYKFWWFRTSLFVTHQNPFFDPNSFAPFGFNMGQGEPTIINTVPGAVIALFAGDVVAYNLIILSSFVIAALGAYLLVREITGNRVGAALAGIAFSFAPYHMSQFAGHIQLMGTGWIALAFYFVEKVFKTGRIRDGVFCGLSLGAAALSAWYYAYITALGLAVYVIARLIGMWLSKRKGVEGMALMPLVKAGVAAVVAFAIVSLPVALPSISLWESGLLRHTAHRADASSAAPVDYAIPNELHPVWGGPAIEAHSQENIIESSLYLGVVVVGIALLGWWAGSRSKKDRVEVVEAAASDAPPKPPGVTRGISLPWLIVLLVAFILSLGLVLHDTSASGEVQINGGSVTLPGTFLFDWLPVYASMRAYARFGVMTLLATVVLMGLGWRAIALRWPQHSLRLGLLACLLLLADFWTLPYAWGLSRVEEDPVQAYVHSLPAGNVMEVPLAAAQNGVSLYNEVYYGKPITYGYDTFQPPEWRVQLETLVAFPSDETLDLLKTWGVRYIVVSGNAYGADWLATLASLRESPRLHYLADFVRQRVWDVDPAVLDARPDLEPLVQPDDKAVFELVQ